MQCPYCGQSDEVYFRNENRYERFLSRTGVAAYFCRACYQHFYEFKAQALRSLHHALSGWLQRDMLTIRYIHSRT
ncbi:MAG: hypothetical protein QUT30_08700 [Acidobacteriota bacterium]|nr:hypothetical protein [Acidobacteriota bacterium]